MEWINRAVNNDPAFLIIITSNYVDLLTSCLFGCCRRDTRGKEAARERVLWEGDWIAASDMCLGRDQPGKPGKEERHY